MAIFETIAAALGPTVGKLLLKNYLGDTAAELGKPLLDIAKARITDGLERRRAENIVNEIADQVIDELRAYFEGERVREVRVAAITEEVQKTLAHQEILPLLLRHDIDPKKTLRAMRSARPLQADALEGAEHQYYDRRSGPRSRCWPRSSTGCPRSSRSGWPKACAACARSKTAWAKSGKIRARS